MDERELLLSHRDGQPRAFAELVARYRAPVFSYLVRAGVDEGSRDDVFQEIFFRIHRAADRYDEKRPLHPWLFTIVANSVRNHLRDRRVRRLVFGFEPPKIEPADSGPDAERTATARQTTARLSAAIDDLGDNQRQVLLLCAVEGLPQKEVAAILEMPIGTVKTHLHRARKSLSRLLEDPE